MPRDIASVMSQDKLRLESALGLDAQEARIEVQMLLQQALGVPRSWLLGHPEQMLEASQLAAYDAMLQRRLQGEPVAHILGKREFFGLSFKVTSATLIPRPDTELLVELALKRLLQNVNPSQPPLVRGGAGAAPSPDKGRAGEGFEPHSKPLRVLDLGTGTGAIALSIAHARPDAEVVAVDASEAALAVARENAQRLAIRNVIFVQSDWFAALGGQRFDLIVSNPPYIAAGDEHLSQGDVRFEPMSALASGLDGLDDIRRIIAQAHGFLERDGWLMLEHGYDQALQVRDLLQQYGYRDVFSAKDIAEIERVSGGISSKIQ